MRRLFLTAFLALQACISGYCADVSNSEQVSFSIISPVDQSLWIATQGHGIVRLGKGGRCFVYSSSKEDFPSDSISVLAFDSEGRLWMKDNAGRLFNYTSLDGFVQQFSEPVGLFPSLSTIPKEETALPEGVTGDHKAPVLPWLIAAISLLLLGCYIVFTSRKPRKKSPAPVVKAVSPASLKPQQNTVQLQNATFSNVSFYDTVMALIKENISNPDFSVEDIAAHTGISRIHVNRKLKAICGLSPSAIIKSERMKIASELLNSGEHSVAEIASICGFSSQTYFSSAFKEYFGVSPTSYKNPGSL